MKSLSMLAVLLVAFLSGCGAPWTVVKRPTPSPIAAAKTFSVKPIDFSSVSIDGTPEPLWRAAHGDAKSRWWDKDKELASQHYLRMITSSAKKGRTFSEEAPADAPVVVLKVGDIRGADFELTVQVTTPDGDVIEEGKTTLTIRGYGVSEEIRGSGKRMADAVAEFIETSKP